jgi:hypothetical protein
MSARDGRIAAKVTKINNQLGVAAARVNNAYVAMSAATNTEPTTVTSELLRAEYNQAVDAQRELLAQRAHLQSCRNMHTAVLPEGAMLLVIRASGDRVVIERRLDGNADHTVDRDGQGYSADDIRCGYDRSWYQVDAPSDAEPMTFEEAIGINDANPDGNEFFRLYSSDEFDELLDNIGATHLDPWSV